MQVKVTYVEMLSYHQREIAPPIDESGERVSVERLFPLAVADYRHYYNAVGKDWHWLSRRKMPDADLARIIDDPASEFHLLRVNSQFTGFVELDRRSTPEIEITQFGLTPPFIGKGWGKWFLQWAIDKAWSYHPTRLWLHTCDLDHPAALPNYLKAGFTIFKEEVIEREL